MLILAGCTTTVVNTTDSATIARHDAFKSAGAQATVGCLYSECDVQDPRADAMRWLATGRQSPANAAQRTTRIWACVGDRELG